MSKHGKVRVIKPYDFDGFEMLRAGDVHEIIDIIYISGVKLYVIDYKGESIPFKSSYFTEPMSEKLLNNKYAGAF